jgi:hypothetical protein
VLLTGTGNVFGAVVSNSKGRGGDVGEIAKNPNYRGTENAGSFTSYGCLAWRRGLGVVWVPKLRNILAHICCGWKLEFDENQLKPVIYTLLFRFYFQIDFVLNLMILLMKSD